MGIPDILKPEDVLNGAEEKSIATYCAYYFDLYSEAPKVREEGWVVEWLCGWMIMWLDDCVVG